MDNVQGPALTAFHNNILILAVFLFVQTRCYAGEFFVFEPVKIFGILQVRQFYHVTSLQSLGNCCLEFLALYLESILAGVFDFAFISINMDEM